MSAPRAPDVRRLPLVLPIPRAAPDRAAHGRGGRVCIAARPQRRRGVQDAADTRRRARDQDIEGNFRRPAQAQGAGLRGRSGGRRRRARPSGGSARRSAPSTTTSSRRGCRRGQIAHESSFLLGNYSPYRPATDSYDAGLCQRNTEHTEPKIAFDPVKSVAALVDRVLNHYEYFEGLPQRRRWELAAGSWNAPAYACYYARKEGAPVDASDTATPSRARRPPSTPTSRP